MEGEGQKPEGSEKSLDPTSEPILPEANLNPQARELEEFLVPVPKAPEKIELTEHKKSFEERRAEVEDIKERVGRELYKNRGSDEVVGEKWFREALSSALKKKQNPEEGPISMPEELALALDDTIAKIGNERVRELARLEAQTNK